MADTQPAVSFFKKGKSRPTTNRRRSVSPTSDARNKADETAPLKSHVVLPSRKQGSQVLAARTKRLRNEEDDREESPERDGPDVKWTAAGSHQHAAQEIGRAHV